MNLEQTFVYYNTKGVTSDGQSTTDLHAAYVDAMQDDSNCTVAQLEDLISFASNIKDCQENPTGCNIRQRHRIHHSVGNKPYSAFSGYVATDRIVSNQEEVVAFPKDWLDTAIWARLFGEHSDPGTSSSQASSIDLFCPCIVLSISKLISVAACNF